MSLFHGVLIAATLLTALVAGFVFAFAVVVMPGLATLDDRAFLGAFQAIDRVIQNNQPLFLVVWVGSAAALVASAVLGLGRLEGVDRLLLLTATLIGIFGVQAPTIAVNVPLNHQIQAVDVASDDEATISEARQSFEARWVRWNTIRTFFATSTTLLLAVLLLRV